MVQPSLFFRCLGDPPTVALALSWESDHEAVAGSIFAERVFSLFFLESCWKFLKINKLEWIASIMIRNSLSSKLAFLIWFLANWRKVKKELVKIKLINTIYERSRIWDSVFEIFMFNECSWWYSLVSHFYMFFEEFPCDVETCATRLNFNEVVINHYRFYQSTSWIWQQRNYVVYMLCQHICNFWIL